MANKFPYVASAGPLVKTVAQLRRSFPKEVTAETLRKLGVAPKNESYAINVLRFLGVIDDEGKPVKDKSKVFLQGEEGFPAAFAGIVREAYDELFDLHGDDAWTMDRQGLTQFFRTTDHSSEIVGTRQAGTFQTLAALSGYSELPTVAQKKPAAKKAAAPAKPKAAAGAEPKKVHAPKTPAVNSFEPRVGLTVRVEVNLPADGDEEVYDRIFRSIRKNLIDAE